MLEHQSRNEDQREIYRGMPSLALSEDPGDVIDEADLWRVEYDLAEHDARRWTPIDEQPCVQVGYVRESDRVRVDAHGWVVTDEISIDQGELIAVAGLGRFEGWDDEDDELDAHETAQTVDLYCVETDRATTYRLAEEDAHDAALAYALGDQLALVSGVRVPAELVTVDEDGFVDVSR